MEELKHLLGELFSGDDDRAEAVIAALASQAGEALPALQPFAASSSPDERWWALRALAAMQGPQVLGMLEAGLKDEDTGVRQCAALGLRLHPQAELTPVLIATLSDPDPLCAALAADTLTEIGAPAVDALLGVLEKGPHPARLEAVRALALIGDHRSIPALFGALDDESAVIEYWANEGLERMGVGMTFLKPE